jgi:soluble lytic murein transglycosylase
VVELGVVRLGLKWRWIAALTVLCGVLSGTNSAAHAQDSATAQSTASSDASAKQAATPQKPAAKSKTAASKAPAKKASSSQTHAAAAHRKRPISPRIRRIREAFVASETLRPMAQQLVQDRNPVAYAGVETYAHAHSKDDAGALAWLVVGYAHVLDHQYAQAVDPLNRAKPLSGDLGDYVAYYLGACYLQTARRRL